LAKVELLIFKEFHVEKNDIPWPGNGPIVRNDDFCTFFLKNWPNFQKMPKSEILGNG